MYFTPNQEVEVKGKGHGVITTKDFKKGEFLCEYSGKLMSYEKAFENEKEYAKDPNTGCYMYFFKHKNKILW